MPDILPLVVVFVVGAIFSGYELLSTTYPMTCYFILRNSRSIYAYSIIYGIISVIFMVGIDYFGIFKCVVTPVLSNIWVQAVFVGISTKAFLHIRFFNADPIPIGFETIVYLFEPMLLKQINLDDYNAVEEYILKTSKGYSNLAEVLIIIERHLPSNDRDLSMAFLQDTKTELDGYIDDDKKILVAMEKYLREYGSSSFQRAFPPRN